MKRQKFKITPHSIFVLIAYIFAMTSISVIASAAPLEDGHDAFDKKDYVTAHKIWLPLAEKGNADAQYNIGIIYMNELGLNESGSKEVTAQNDGIALKWFIKSAEQGVTDAQYNAGVMYYEGRGAYTSHKSAVEYWQLATAKGHANSQYNLAIMYAYGYGVSPNKRQAIELWRLAADQGHPSAINALITVYRGDFPGFEANEEKLNYWLKRRP